VELAVDAPDAVAARVVVEALSRELLCNPLIEQYAIESLGAISAARTETGG
jgi:phosphoribosylformylglycinamidine (FGAM) synthase PurS component